MNTTERAHKLIAEQLGVEPERVRPDVRLIPADYAHHDWSTSGGDDTHLGADSLDVVEIVMLLEDEFGVEIPDDEVSRVRSGTVKDLTDLVEAKLAA